MEKIPTLMQAQLIFNQIFPMDIVRHFVSHPERCVAAHRFVYSCMRWLGIHTISDLARPMKKMVQEVISKTEPDEQGYFLERY